MIRMSVVWAGCLLPVLAGCGSLRNLTATDTAKSPTAGPAEPAPRPEVSAAANVAWNAFHERQPQPFSNEFHEGFLAGCADYLNRGSAALPPTPPASYAASKNPQAPGSGDAVRDYQHGFRYGVYAAMVGKRSGDSVASAPPVNAPPVASAVKPSTDSTAAPAATVSKQSTDPVSSTPMKLPPAMSVSRPSADSAASQSLTKTPPPTPDARPNLAAPTATQWNTFAAPAKTTKGADEPTTNSGPTRAATEPSRTVPQTNSAAPYAPTESGRTIPPLPKPELPIIPPFNPDLSGVEKLVPLPVPTDSGRFPIPSPPLPAPDTKVVPLPVPTGEPRNVLPPIREPLTVPVPAVKIDLPVPSIPAPPVSAVSVPTPALPTSGTSVPPILGTIPPIPFRPTIDEK